MNLYNTKCTATMGSTLFKPWDLRTFVIQNIHNSEVPTRIHYKIQQYKMYCYYGVYTFEAMGPQNPFYSKHSHFWGTRSLVYIMSLDNIKCTAWHYHGFLYPGRWGPHLINFNQLSMLSSQVEALHFQSCIVYATQLSLDLDFERHQCSMPCN